MVDILDPPSLHQEHFPAEIDVYKVPHNRMKQLVSSITEKLPEIQESLNFDQREAWLESTLEHIYSTVWELKTHEIIENTVIMTQLKERLRSRQIYNQSVCNCHEDSDLVRILDLLEAVYSATDGVQRNYYWQNLQEALYEFLDDFLPHMEEEETVFQPLLIEYFNYEELKQLQETVLSQHKEWQQKVNSEKSLKRFKRDSESQESSRDEEEAPVTSCERLPEEIVHQIFCQLTDPRDLGRAGQVCRRWSKVARSPQFWRSLPLAQWERGTWSWADEDLHEVIEGEAASGIGDLELGDTSIYEDILELLKTTGTSVRKFSVCGSKSLTNITLREMLKTMPNLRSLDCSYTAVCHAAFTGCGPQLAALESLDMSGCSFVTDQCVQCLVARIPDTAANMKWMSFSGCAHLTDESLRHLRKFSKTLHYVDFSGCSRVSGSALRQFIENCPNIQMENVFYCSYIEDGPDPATTSGCQNTDCDIRFCCSSYQN